MAEFAVRLAGVIMVSMVMRFSWVGGPGEFVAWSMAAQCHHRSFNPPDPSWNDIVANESRWLMDDGVVLEPLVGNRVWHSMLGLRLIWGPEGVNVEKMAEEGHPSACQLLWILFMSFDTLEVTLPEPKRIKYLLGEPSLQRGCTSVPAKLLRELAGCAQYCAVVCPELRPHLATLYALLRGGKSEWAAPAEDTDPEVVWTEFWDTLDFICLQLERPIATSFHAAFQKLLPIRELLALPGTADRTTRWWVEMHSGLIRRSGG